MGAAAGAFQAGRERFANRPQASTLPPDLPPAEQFTEGSLVVDDTTGQRYRVRNGQWAKE